MTHSLSPGMHPSISKSVKHLPTDPQSAKESQTSSTNSTKSSMGMSLIASAPSSAIFSTATQASCAPSDISFQTANASPDNWFPKSSRCPTVSSTTPTAQSPASSQWLASQNNWRRSWVSESSILEILSGTSCCKAMLIVNNNCRNIIILPN